MKNPKNVLEANALLALPQPLHPLDRWRLTAPHFLFHLAARSLQDLGFFMATPPESASAARARLPRRSSTSSAGSSTSARSRLGRSGTPEAVGSAATMPGMYLHRCCFAKLSAALDTRGLSPKVSTQVAPLPSHCQRSTTAAPQHSPPVEAPQCCFRRNF